MSRDEGVSVGCQEPPDQSLYMDFAGKSTDKKPILELVPNYLWLVQESFANWVLAQFRAWFGPCVSDHKLARLSGVSQQPRWQATNCEAAFC